MPVDSGSKENHMASRDSFFNLESVHRIYIIGGMGSGKTTLARKLAACPDIPVYHLDEIYRAYASKAEGLFDLLSTHIHCIATQSAWITEGIYLGWTHELLYRADVIIWLDISWLLALWRQIKRFAWVGLTEPSSGPIQQKLMKMLRFLYELWSERKYYLDSCIMDQGTPHDASAKNRATTARYLASCTGRLIRCRTPSQVEILLTGIR